MLKIAPKLCTAVIALLLSACCNEAPEVAPSPEHARLDECLLLCAEIDVDPLNAPANQCPGPDDDTSYALCTGECFSRRPNGNWCPPP
jgi:hypothetical protein